MDLWTPVLVLSAGSALYTVETHPRIGWPLYTLSEVIWIAYGLSIGAPAVTIMAAVYLLLGLRNWRKSLCRVRPQTTPSSAG